MTDYGFKISKPGVDTGSANPEDLYFSSKYFNFKEKAAGSFVFKTGQKTYLDAPFPIGATTATVDYTTDYSDTGVFACYAGVFGQVEYVKYTSKDATHFYGCTRGYWGSTERDWEGGNEITPAYTKRTIYTHSLSYYPVIFCWAKNPASVTLALPFCTALSVFYYFITSDSLIAAKVTFGEIGPPAGGETWTIYYHCMYDKIK